MLWYGMYTLHSTGTIQIISSDWLVEEERKKKATNKKRLMEKKKKPAASAHSCDNNSNSMIHIRSSWKSTTTTTTTTTTISQNTHELKCMIPTYITSKTSGCRSFVHFNLLSTHQKPEMRVSTKPNNPITYHKHKMTSTVL